MGEANRRKAIDPTFGQEKRGLVVSPPIEIDSGRLYARSSQLDSQELRAWLLFFDQLVWPSSRAIYFASGPDELFLEQCNILSRPDYTISGNAGDVITHAHERAFFDLDSKEPGRWSLAQGDNSLLIKNNILEPNSGVSLNLYNAIPVPNHDVPLNEILEFKRKRFDELVKLRTEIDKFVAVISAAEDQENEIKKCVKLIDTACADAIRVSHEWKFPVRITNFKSSFDIRPFVTLAGGFTAYSASNQLMNLSSIQTALTAIGGAALASAPALKLEGSFGWNGLKRRLGPYRYVYQFHNELF